ncbi:MAG TPA: AbrB/MazE/SpoVT family DNA-binding domain-containing protein [Solirubrobacterales bacterium]|nr:AbrB/MazE/SpoVT family DNA-binding domain-containing protein [Solirubrobacterales bacterium]
MRITSKGQVTIPKGIRDQFGLLPGTEVQFVVEGGQVKVRKLDGDRTRGRAIVDQLKNVTGGDISMSTEEIMRLTRGEDWGTGNLEEGDGNPR